jgi:hypothetical protein
VDSRFRGNDKRGTSEVVSASTCCGDYFQLVYHFLNGDYVTVLGVYVVEVCLVGVGVAVAYGLARDDGAEAVLEGVDGSCADAARGGCAGDDKGVRAGGGEEAGEAVPKKPDAKSLLRTGSVSSGEMRGSISAHRVPACSVRSAGTLSMKAAAVNLSDSR